MGVPRVATPRASLLVVGGIPLLLSGIGLGGLPATAAGQGVDGAHDLHLSVEGPAAPLLTDAAGRRVGLDLESGRELREVPGAWYEVWEVAPLDGAPGEVDGPVHRVTVMGAPDGEYTIRVVGMASGSYRLSVIVVGRDASPARKADPGPVALAPGETHVYHLDIGRDGAPRLARRR